VDGAVHALASSMNRDSRVRAALAASAVVEYHALPSATMEGYFFLRDFGASFSSLGKTDRNGLFAALHGLA